MNTKQHRINRLTITMALTALLIVGLAFLAINTEAPTSQAAPPLVITPLSVTNSDSNLNVTFLNALVSDATTETSNAKQLAAYEIMDLQYVLDFGTANTATLILQHSNDNSNWATGVTLASNKAADTNDMVQVANHGRYTRVKATLTNTENVTITVIAVAK